MRVWSGQVHLLPPPQPVYQPFLSDGAHPPGRADVDVEVVLEQPSGPRGPLMFRTETNWAMHEEPTGYRLVFSRRDHGCEYMQVLADEATAGVKIHVDRSFIRGADELQSPLSYPLDQILLMNHLASQAGVIVHAAGAQMGGGTIAFCGSSGAGKTTLARLFVAAGLSGRVLNDDRLIIRQGRAGEFHAYGTPWPGDAKITLNQSAPLRALLFLAKAPTPRLVPLAPGRAAQRLMPVVSCPWYDRVRGPRVLDTCSRIVERVACYELQFTPDTSTIDLLTNQFGTA